MEKSKKCFKFVWSKEERIFYRTGEESKHCDENGQIKQSKQHVVNKVDDMLGLGWSKNYSGISHLSNHLPVLNVFLKVSSRQTLTTHMLLHIFYIS